MPVGFEARNMSASPTDNVPMVSVAVPCPNKAMPDSDAAFDRRATTTMTVPSHALKRTAARSECLYQVAVRPIEIHSRTSITHPSTTRLTPRSPVALRPVSQRWCYFVDIRVSA